MYTLVERYVAQKLSSFGFEQRSTYVDNLRVEGFLSPVRHVWCQAALLYTSASGKRRVRCHTLGLPVTAVLPNLFRSVGERDT